MAEASNTAKYLAEALGTFALVFSVGCNVLGGSGAFGGISIAATLMVMIYALGGVSGGHFNPAVSVAIALTDKNFGWDQCGIYSVCQLLGGCIGASSYAALFGKTFNLAPSSGYSTLDACGCEMLYTFMLVFTVLNVAVAKKSQPNEYFGLAIAFTVVAGAYGAGKVSGGAFNPAVAFSLDIVSAGWGFGYCGPYILAELLAAVAAHGLFRVVRAEEFGGQDGSMTAKLVSEFLGTFFLVTTVGLNVASNPSPAAVFSIASSLMCMIYALGNVSGGHFNPAVTVAILCAGRNKTNVSEAMQYIVAQLAGGVCAGAVFGAIMGGVPINNNNTHSWGSIGVAEFIFTFVLCFTVLGVATTRAALAQFFALAIGFCVIVGGYAIGGISGGHLNPAVSMGLDASGGMYSGAGFHKSLIYAVPQLAAGATAAGVFMVTHATEFGKSKAPKDLEYGSA